MAKFDLQHGIIIILAIGLILAAVMASWNAGSLEPDTISVSGEASMKAEPNQVDVSITIETDSESSLDSQQNNARISTNVKKALLNFGLSEDNIETSQYDLRIIRDKVTTRTTLPASELGKPLPPDSISRIIIIEENETEVIKYRTTHTFDVKLTELNRTGALIDLAVAIGANRISSINFGLTEEKQKELKSQLLLDATTDARKKAEIIASQSNARITGIRQITESSPIYFGVRSVALESIPSAVFMAETPITSGLISVSTNIHAVYRISN